MYYIYIYGFHCEVQLQLTKLLLFKSASSHRKKHPWTCEQLSIINILNFLAEKQWFPYSVHNSGTEYDWQEIFFPLKLLSQTTKVHITYFFLSFLLSSLFFFFYILYRLPGHNANWCNRWLLNEFPTLMKHPIVKVVYIHRISLMWSKHTHMSFHSFTTYSGYTGGAFQSYRGPCELWSSPARLLSITSLSQVQSAAPSS